MRYAYWSFNCKSCGLPLLVTYIGPYDENYEIPQIQIQGGIEKICPSCGKGHYYKSSEATVFLGWKPPSVKP